MHLVHMVDDNLTITICKTNEEIYNYIHLHKTTSTNSNNRIIKLKIIVQER
jgi:hypothetical protein